MGHNDTWWLGRFVPQCHCPAHHSPAGAGVLGDIRGETFPSAALQGLASVFLPVSRGHPLVLSIMDREHRLFVFYVFKACYFVFLELNDASFYRGFPLILLGLFSSFFFYFLAFFPFFFPQFFPSPLILCVFYCFLFSSFFYCFFFSFLSVFPRLQLLNCTLNKQFALLTTSTC